MGERVSGEASQAGDVTGELLEAIGGIVVEGDLIPRVMILWPEPGKVRVQCHGAAEGEGPTVAKAIDAMIRNMREQIQQRLQEGRSHVERLERVSGMIDKAAPGEGAS